MLSRQILSNPQELREKINQAYRMVELNAITDLIDYADLTSAQLLSIQSVATNLMKTIRELRKQATGIDSFLTQYALSSEEGIALMCLAEALLRVPDPATIDDLIKDKLAQGDWGVHRGQSESMFVNAATWALMLTGKVLDPSKAESVLTKALFKLMNKSSESVIRKSVETAMRIMSKQFVMGQNIHEAILRAKKKEVLGYRYSYDMLGEAVLTREDAQRYFKAYTDAIHAIGACSDAELSVYQKPGVSIKLSALYPRYQESLREQVIQELCPILLELAKLAKSYDIGLTIDAEESERLDLSLDVIECVLKNEELEGWNGFGLALQSYHKRAFFVLDWIESLAKTTGRRIMVRLVKGAYWDSEIKKAQMLGLVDYPVFTRKAFTDVSFQACVKKMLTMTDTIYPQFATHNAYSVALILELAGEYTDFEFQCLHGMGMELYEQIVPKSKRGVPCRIYAPVGVHEDLLPYLVRRLLENGANSSFVNRIVDDKESIEDLVMCPVTKSRHLLSRINQNIPLPASIFLPERKNSYGIDLTDRQVVAKLQHQLSDLVFPWFAGPMLAALSNEARDEYAVRMPAQTNRVIGKVHYSTNNDVELALQAATRGFEKWSQQSVEHRAACLLRFATLLEENMPKLLSMLCLEAGKTFNDGIAEVREAVDFCRYYAAKAEQVMTPVLLHGYTGESNEWSLHPRGIMVCISPWNFPLAIFVGQIVAALVTGNAVIAKPAEQTSLIAAFAVKLMHQADIPSDAIQLLPGQGEVIGAALIADSRVQGVLFTGSTEVAALIHQTLANRRGPIVPLIAETGGQNVMIVDSSALLEQVTVDVLASAFGSAGQRCSALRVLYIQEEVYPRMLSLLKGAMSELKIGDPQWLSTDIGPVIDQEALSMLKKYVEDMQSTHEIIYQCQLSEEEEHGYFMPPTVIAIHSLTELSREVFGPVLHILPFKRKELDAVIADINQTGYGLTMGIHSRINQTIEYIRQRVHVGNCYVNRNIVGAVVGLQPFGGEGLSGTGPKAGGPLYLQRLCHERTLTCDTTAAGGNASLMSISDEKGGM